MKKLVYMVALFASILIYSSCTSSPSLGNAQETSISKTSPTPEAIVPDLTVPGNTKRYSDFDTAKELRLALQPIADASGVIRFYPPMVRSFLVKLPKIKKEIDEKTQDVEGVELDIILIKHPKIDRDEMHNNPGFLKSQERVKKILLNLKPEIIGVEGFSANTITPEQQVLEASREGADWEKLTGDEHVSLEHYRLVARYDFSVMADRAYLTANPNVAGIGLEEESLYRMQTRWMSLLGSLEDDPDADPNMELSVKVSFFALTYFRSEYAIAKLISEMKRRSISRGAIVIGLFHGPDMIAFCQTRGIKANFYHTCPAQCNEVPKEKILTPAY